MPNEETAPDPHLRLWRCLREYILYGFALFGAPNELAQRLWLSRAEHKRVCDFLRPLEDLLRRLIFIKALELMPLAPPAPSETKRHERAGMPARFGAVFDPDNPETWRVSFELWSARPLASAKPQRLRYGVAGPAAHASPEATRSNLQTPALHNISAAPAAMRMEALLRGFNDPDKLARAMARRLRKNAKQALDFIAEPRFMHATHVGYLTLLEAAGLCLVALKLSLLGLDSS